MATPNNNDATWSMGESVIWTTGSFRIPLSRSYLIYWTTFKPFWFATSNQIIQVGLN